MANLLVSVPQAGDVIHDLKGEKIVIGRTSDNTVQIEDPSVALHHIRLTWDGHAFLLKNLTDEARTLVDGKPVTEATLSHRCALRLGNVECVFFPTDAGAEKGWQHRAQLAAISADRDAMVEQMRQLQAEAARLQSENAALERRAQESAQQRAGYEHSNEQLSRQLVELRHRTEMMSRGADGDAEHYERLHADLRGALAKIVTLEEALADREARVHAADAQRVKTSTAIEIISEALVVVSHEVQAISTRWDGLAGALERAQQAAALLSGNTGASPAWAPESATLEPRALASPTADPSVAGLPEPPPALRRGHQQPVNDFAPILPELPGDLPHYNARKAIDAMALAAERLRTNRYDRMALNELFSGSRALAQRRDDAETPGAMRRMASTLEALLGDLCKLPEQLNADRFRTISRAIETLRLLVERDHFAATRDLLRAKVCVVSDDAEEPMIAAMRLVDFDLSIINYPTERMEAVAEEDCELIILDPGQNEKNATGCCQRVRGYARHRHTSILLLITPDVVDGPPGPGGEHQCDDMLHKPFNAYEMAAKILIGIFAHRLAPAPAAG